MGLNRLPTASQRASSRQGIHVKKKLPTLLNKAHFLVDFLGRLCLALAAAHAPDWLLWPRPWQLHLCYAFPLSSTEEIHTSHAMVPQVPARALVSTMGRGM